MPAKSTILFVDDDANILGALQRMLHSQRGQWAMTFVDGAQKALALLATQNFDMVVSDMRMPDLDGAGLLSQVEHQSPGTFRVILSGYAEEKSVFRTVGPAHQYVAKPCEPAVLIGLMDRALALRDVLTQPQLRVLAAGLRNLPSPPDLYLKLTEEARKETTALNTISQLIAKDVAMTAALLKLTNSAYFALNVRISSAEQAVRLLGLDTVRTLVLSAGIFKQFSGNPDLAPLVQSISDYSLVLAQMAQRMAEEDGADRTMQGLTLCAAMLCCIGSLVLLDSDPYKFREAMDFPGQAGLEARERELFGATQAELGAYLLGLWGFNNAIIEAALYHMRPSDCTNQGKSVLTYVHLARVLGPAFPLREEPDQPRELLDTAYIERLGLTRRLAQWSRDFATQPKGLPA
jgi:HD-like signal output (HDOD) protein/ActR/RegA family two-component response regulator